jgi:hypothetical protein
MAVIAAGEPRICVLVLAQPPQHPARRAKLPDAPAALPEVLSLETEQRIAYAERVLALLIARHLCTRKKREFSGTKQPVERYR